MRIYVFADCLESRGRTLVSTNTFDPQVDTRIGIRVRWIKRTNKEIAKTRQMRAKPSDPTFPHDGRFQHISTMAVTLEQAFIDVHVLSYSLVVECSCTHTVRRQQDIETQTWFVALQHARKNYCALYSVHVPFRCKRNVKAWPHFIRKSHGWKRFPLAKHLKTGLKTQHVNMIRFLHSWSFMSQDSSGCTKMIRVMEP